MLSLFSFTTHATIWITVSDPQSNKIAVVGASSGHIGDKRTMVPVDNYGIAVVGSWYLGNNQDHLKKLIRNETLSASEVAKEFSRLINLDSHKRRVSFVNARFHNASVPGRGCHASNHYCGKYEDDRFTVTGGGLESENVILAAKDVLLDRNVQRMPIECQLYKSIEAVFAAGGEYKKIERLAFHVDDVGLDKDGKTHLYFRKGGEGSLLTQFKTKLSSMGLTCNAQVLP